MRSAGLGRFSKHLWYHKKEHYNILFMKGRSVRMQTGVYEHKRDRYVNLCILCTNHYFVPYNAKLITTGCYYVKCLGAIMKRSSCESLGAICIMERSIAAAM